MSKEKEEQLAAISEAIDVELEDETLQPETNEDPEPEPETTEEEASGEETAAESPEGDEPDGSGVSEDGGEEGGEGAPESTAEGEPETPAEPDPAGPADAAAEAVGGDPKPSDEFGELPKDAKEETRQRFETMKARFDEVAGERDTYKEQNEQWMGTVQATGTNPEQLNAAFQYLTAVNSGDVAGLERAYEFLQAEAAVIGKMLGKEGPGYDPLEEHPDLKKRVDDLEIERADALQIAEARAVTNTTAQAQKSAASTQQQQQDAQGAQDQGLRDLATLGNELRKDPDWGLKEAGLKQYIANMVRSGVSPDQWGGMAKLHYQSMTVVAPPPPRPDTTPNSVRPSGPGEGRPGVNKEPGSALEAVTEALGIA